MNTNKLLFFVVILAACLTQFASDIYAPSLPAIAYWFNASINLAQWSMAIYMVGVALTLLVYGPLSDGIGRKTPMILGLTIMTMGSLLCVFAPSVYILILGRFIQGCGAGACAGLWRPIFRDLFTGEQLAQYGSYFAIFIMFIVPTAPAIGGYLQEYFGWRASFVFMACYALFALLCVWAFFKETSLHHHKDKLRPNFIFSTYRQLLTNGTFMKITLCTFLSYGAFFAWLTTGSVLLIHGLGMNPAAFGLFTFLGGGIAYAIAGWLNGKVVKKFGMNTMLRFGWSVMIFSCLMLLGGYVIYGLNEWAILIPIVLFYFGSTFIWPNAFAIAFTPFGQIAGYAGALYGFMQIGGGAVMGILMSYLPETNQLPLALTMLLCSICAWGIFEW